MYFHNLPLFPLPGFSGIDVRQTSKVVNLKPLQEGFGIAGEVFPPQTPWRGGGNPQEKGTHPHTHNFLHAMHKF